MNHILMYQLLRNIMSTSGWTSNYVSIIRSFDTSQPRMLSKSIYRNKDPEYECTVPYSAVKYNGIDKYCCLDIRVSGK